MKKILLITGLIFLLGSINAQTNSGVGKYNNAFKDLNSRQTGDSDKAKERKKLSKYFEKLEYDKAEEYAAKVAPKSGKIVFVLLADNYFLKGKQELGDENYQTAIDFFNKALLFYKRGDYERESQFVKRDLGICYLSLFKKNLADNNLIVNSYDNFTASNSIDLIEKYDEYLALVYLRLYKATFKDAYLEKAFESCSNNENIMQFKNPCANTAKALYNDYKVNTHNKDNLEKSIALYKKLNMQAQQDETNETLANYYIDKTKKPELAYEYLNRVTTVNSSKLDSYTRKIDGKLISYCYTVDDCIVLADRKPELKEQVFPRAIEVAKTMEDCDKLYRYYPSKKSDVKSKALSLIKTIDDCQEAYNYFPSKKSEIGALAIKLANSFKQLGYIYLQFDNIATDAETKALYNIVDIDDKKEFVQYFPNSSFSPDIQKEIDVEEALDTKMDMAKESMNELIMNTYAEGKKCEQVFSSINYEEEENMVIGVSYKFTWSVYFNARPIAYKIDIKARLYLEDGSCVIGKVNLLMDDDVQELDLFNTIKPKLVSVIKTFIGDLTTLNTLKEKRKISYEVPQYYKFSSIVSASEEELPEYVGSDDDEEVYEQQIFQVVEDMPEYPGGRSALMKYLAININYPPYAKEAGIQGRVFINFVVETDGSITAVRVLRGIGGGCDEEAIRVVKNMPKWKPGMQRGKSVRVSFNLPVKFTLQ